MGGQFICYNMEFTIGWKRVGTFNNDFLPNRKWFLARDKGQKSDKWYTIIVYKLWFCSMVRPYGTWQTSFLHSKLTSGLSFQPEVYISAIQIFRLNSLLDLWDDHVQSYSSIHFWFDPVKFLSMKRPFNPYPRFFGTITERVLWKKNPDSSLVTSQLGLRK